MRPLLVVCELALLIAAGCSIAAAAEGSDATRYVEGVLEQVRATPVECPAKRKLSWFDHEVFCASYDDDAARVASRWDALLEAEGIGAVLADRVLEVTTDEPSPILRRAYLVDGHAVLVLIHERQPLIVLAWAVDTSPAPGPSYDADAHPLRGYEASGADTGVMHAGTAGVTEPRRVRYVQPTYPKKAKKQRAGGAVTLQALIHKDGTVSEVTVLSCTNPGYGFEQASVEAVRQWRYEPARFEGEPVDVYFTVETAFDIRTVERSPS